MPNGQPPKWLAALPSLFAIGAKLGGAPTVGTAAIQGAEQGKLRQQEQDQIALQNSQRQQALDLQTQNAMAQQAARAEQQEQRRQQAIKGSIDDLRVQQFKTKKDYDTAVGAHEQMLGQFFGVRPNTLRTLVPYNGPTAKEKAREVLEPLIKEHGFSKVAGMKGLVQFDRDGEDGIAEGVDVQEALKIGGYSAILDPVTKQPIEVPKEVKPENVQQFDERFKGVLAEYAAEGKKIDDPVVRGNAVDEALKRIAAASKTGNASVNVTVPERPMTRYQRYSAERGLRTDADKHLAPVRELNRQVEVMRQGLAESHASGRLGPGTQAVINSFNRIMEPGSVTREAEYLRSTAGQPLLESLKGRVQALQAGGPGVTFQTLEDTVRLAERIAEESAKFTAEPLRMIGEQASEFGIPTDRVLPAESSYRLKQRQQVNPPAAGAPGADVRARARQILQQGKYDTSDASVDKFLANPRNRALLGIQ